MELLLPKTGLIFWTIFSALVFVLFIVALFSVLKTNFKDSTTKLIWILVILVIPGAGPIFYFLIGRRQQRQ
jgi:beta-lactamase regulating signal transducer with metallopeptidase domain